MALGIRILDELFCQVVSIQTMPGSQRDELTFEPFKFAHLTSMINCLTSLER